MEHALAFRLLDGFSVLLLSDYDRALAAPPFVLCQLRATRDGAPIGEPLRHDPRAAPPQFSPDGKVLALIQGDQLLLRETSRGRPIGAPLACRSRPRTVRFSPGGQEFACGCDDGTVWVASVAADRPAPERHKVGEGVVFELRFSPDGKAVITSALESTFQPATATTLDRTVVRLWAFPAFDSIGEPVTLEARARRPEAKPETYGLTFFVAQGATAVVVGREQLIRIDVKSGHAERLRDFSACEEVVVDDDGTVKARVGSGINSSVRLWSSDTGTEIPLPRGDTLPAEIFPMALAPDDTMRCRLTMAAGGLDGILTTSPTLLADLPGRDRSGDENPAGLTRRIGLWRAAPGLRIGRLIRPELSRWVSHLGFDRSGSRLFTVATGEGYYSLGGLGIWEVPTGRRLGEFSGADAVITLDKFALSPVRPGVVLKAGSGHLRWFDESTAAPGATLFRVEENVNAFELSPDGRRLVVGIGSFEPRGGGSGKGRAILYDAVAGRPIGALLGHDGSVLSVAFSPDGRLVLTGGGDKTARLWDGATGRPVGVPWMHPGHVTNIVFHPRATSALTACTPDASAAGTSAPGEARLWDVATGRPIGGPMSHIDRITALSFSPDGTVVLTASLDGSARLWDATDGKPLGDPLEHPLAVTSATFSPDGMLVASGCRDGAVRLWDVATQMPVGPPLRHQVSPTATGVLGRPGQETVGVFGLAFAPRRDRAILASHTAYDARLWEIPGPLTVDDARVGLWVQLTTAAELLPNGTFKPLDPGAWDELRTRQDAGGR